MKKILFLFLLLSSISFGQNKFTVYFDTDSDQLRLNELTRFDDFLRNKKVKFTKLIGYCDYRATNGYNDTLAFNRAKFVSHIIEKVADQKQIEIESKGENFEQNSDLALNRKVEIYYEETPIEVVEKVATNNLINQVSNAKVGDKLILKNLYFYDRSGILRPESKPVMEELLAIMRANPKLKIEIQGHICCIDKDYRNLSTDRAKQIKRFLVYNGIQEYRVKTKGFGVSQPIYPIPEATPEQAAANRRVEIEILSKK